MDTQQQLYLELYKEYRTELRHQETQRSAVSGALVAFSGVIIGFAFKQEADNHFYPYLGLILINLSIVAFAISQKLYERFLLARSRTHLYLEALDRRTEAVLKASGQLPVEPHDTLQRIWAKSDKSHSEKYPFFYLIRLHSLWEALLIGSGLIGAFFWIFSAPKSMAVCTRLSLTIAGPIFQLAMLFIARMRTSYVKHRDQEDKIKQSGGHHSG